MESKFDGGVLGLIGVGIVTFLLSLIPVVGGAIGICYQQRWIKSHTTIEGRRLKFVGNWAEFFIKYFLWTILTIITLFIYYPWFALNVKKWETANTVFDDDVDAVEA